MAHRIRLILLRCYPFAEKANLDGLHLLPRPLLIPQLFDVLVGAKDSFREGLPSAPLHPGGTHLSHQQELL